MKTVCTSAKLRRLLIVLGIVLLHGGVYYTVNALNSLRPSSVIVNLYTIVDSWIPFVGWTWTIYYFGDVYITVWALIIVWRLSEREFGKAVYSYIGMIIAGALIQLVVPGKAPWPNHLSGAQAYIHDLISMKPYACLPSMHVALTVLPACLLFTAFRSSWVRAISTVMAVLIIITTLTMKEHFFLDALTGVLFGLVFFGVWRLSLRNISQKGQKVWG
jgi:hypothetical protein